jgi:MoaA/NifB/PqqE/SkfB family radical SAM enzyme
MYKVTSYWPHHDTVKIEWNLSKRCNYDCSYCPSEIHDNSSKHTDIEILKSTIDKLVSLNKTIRLSFTGGEPTVHPKFDELIKYAKKSGINWISVTTNGTRPYEFYKNLDVDQYVVSIHLEYNWSKVVDLLLHLANSTNIKLIGQIMAHNDFMDHVKIIRNLLNDSKIPNTVRRIRWTDGDHDDFDDTRYSNDYLLWIKDQDATIQGNCIIDNETIIHANEIIKHHLNMYKGWSCKAGIESLMINWDGEVYRATCRVGGSIGNIFSGFICVPDKPILCTRDWCTCAADIPLTKEKNV